MNPKANKQPGSPLPFTIDGDAGTIILAGDGAQVAVANRIPVVGGWRLATENVAYMVHAAVAYEGLVVALRKLIAAAQPIPVPMGEQFSDPFPTKFAPQVEDAKKLLADLGES
jgi:hypothetical protein